MDGDTSCPAARVLAHPPRLLPTCKVSMLLYAPLLDGHVPVHSRPPDPMPGKVRKKTAESWLMQPRRCQASTLLLIAWLVLILCLIYL
jgi:hypothetical protein